MAEFFQLAFSPAVGLLSVLLGLVLLYWLIVIIGLLETDFLDFGLDGDPDVDLDVDGAAEAAGMGEAFQTMLAFFYVGRVPVTVLATILIFGLWTLAMLGNHLLNPGGGFWLGVPVAIGSFVGALLMVKALAWPFSLLCGVMHSEGNQLQDAVGSMCVLQGRLEPGRIGQAVVKTGAAPLVITVVSDGGQPLARGQEAVVLEYRRAEKVYAVAPVDLGLTQTGMDAGEDDKQPGREGGQVN
jgi:hypothetical protein